MKDSIAERKNSFVAGLMARYIRLVFSTSMRNEDYDELAASYDKNAPLIIGGWHGTFLLAPLLLPKPKEFSAVVARHGDAELMGLMLERFGVKLIRGAGAGGRKANKGGVFALRMSLRELKAGRSIALTADVPPGPARQAGIGIITIARLSGRPILPVAAVSSRFLVLNSWSRFVINLPFSKLVLLTGELVHVPKNADKELMEAKRLELQSRLNDLVERGHELVGADPARTETPEVGAAPNPGLALKAYSGAMKLIQPLAGTILARRAKRGKEDLSRQSERFGRSGEWRPEGRLIWFHGASVGETNAVLPLINSLRERYSATTILLTTGTVTSAKIAGERLPQGAIHQFIPFDTPEFMQRFLDHWHPDLALLVESEIWPNLVLETYARKIPLVLVNGIMSQKSYRNWRRQGAVSRPIFGRFDLVLVQNENLRKRFMRLGAPQVEVVGNLKFDAPPLPIDRNKRYELNKALGERPLFLAASTHPGEEELIFQVHKNLVKKVPDLLTIIVPRHPQRGSEVTQMARTRNFDCAQRSKGVLPSATTDLYIADTLGELGLFYDLAKIALVGGSLVQNGGHNPIEAVRFGALVITGPHWHNQTDIFSALLKGGGALEAKTAVHLADLVLGLINDQQRQDETVAKAEQIVDELTGAVERTIEAISPLLPGPKSPDPIEGSDPNR